MKDWLFASPRSISVTIYVLSVWQQGGEAETPVESLVPAHPGDLIEQSYPETGMKTSDLYRTKNIPERFNHPGSSQSIFVKECDLQIMMDVSFSSPAHTPRDPFCWPTIIVY